MKLLAIILALAFSSIDGFAQMGWKYLNSGVSQNLHSVEFATENFGIAVGDSGMALKTVDGGLNWEQLNFPVELDLSRINFMTVAFTGENSAVIAGNSIQPSQPINKLTPVILRTTDAGITWQLGGFDKPEDIDTMLAMRSMCMADNFTGYLVFTANLSQSQIFRTIDGGANWQLFKVHEYYTIENFDCSNENSYTAAVRTVEPYHGSQTQRINGIIEIPDSNIMRKFSNDIPNWFGYFITEAMGNNSWLLAYKENPGDYFTIHQTVNNGITWNETGVSFENINFFFNSFPSGYAITSKKGDSRNLLKSNDGGQTWFAQKHPADIPGIYSIYSINDTLAYAVGEKGTILKVSDDATSVEENQPKVLKEILAYPNPATNELIIDGISSELTLINSFGNVVWSGFKNEEKLKIDISAFSQGIYVLKNSAGVQMISVVR